MELNYWNYTLVGSILKCDLGYPFNITQVLKWKDRMQKSRARFKKFKPTGI